MRRHVKIPDYYEEDIVCFPDTPSKYGQIQRTAWKFDDISDDTSEEEDKLELPPGHVEVLWNDGTSGAVFCQQLTVVDRSLLHGDICVRTNHPQEQTGTVVDVKIFVDIEMTKSKETLEFVSSRYLTDSIYPVVEQNIALLSKPNPNKIQLVGAIESVSTDIHVTFEDGATCIVLKAQPDFLQPKEAYDEDAPYYPSQLVSASSAVWKKAVWTLGSYKPKSRKAKRKVGTVTKVVIDDITIDWVSGYSEKVVYKQNDLFVLDHYAATKVITGEFRMIHPKVRQMVAAVDPNERMESQKKIDAFMTEITAANWTGSENDCCRIMRTRTFVKVQWQDGVISNWMAATKLMPRDHLLDIDFWPGDFVIAKPDPNMDNSKARHGKRVGMVCKVNNVEQTTIVKWKTPGSLTIEEEEVSVYAISDHPTFTYRLGSIVLSYRTGQIGEVVGINFETAALHVLYSVAIDGLIKYESRDEEPSSLVLIDTDNSSSSSSSTEESSTNSEDAKQRAKDLKKRSARNAKYVKKFNEWHRAEQAEHSETETQERLLSDSVAPFNILETPIEKHYYLNQEALPNQKFARAVMKEWKLLSTALPPNVFIRAYSQRIDLLKVLIIGPTETIYCGSYFVFDIYLPPSFPNDPPLVYYHSCGYKLHPNLYDDGKICLSLLGTWQGDESETWNPKKSNILQLIISIQGLILGVREPYYLEAGYDKQFGTKQGAASSKRYNEMGLLFSIKLMIYMVKNPPTEFKTIIPKSFDLRKSDWMQMADHCFELIRELQPNNPNNEAKSSSPSKPIMTNHDHSQSYSASQSEAPMRSECEELFPWENNVSPRERREERAKTPHRHSRSSSKPTKSPGGEDSDNLKLSKPRRISTQISQHETNSPLAKSGKYELPLSQSYNPYDQFAQFGSSARSRSSEESSKDKGPSDNGKPKGKLLKSAEKSEESDSFSVEDQDSPAQSSSFKTKFMNKILRKRGDEKHLHSLERHPPREREHSEDRKKKSKKGEDSDEDAVTRKRRTKRAESDEDPLRHSISSNKRRPSLSKRPTETSSSGSKEDKQKKKKTPQKKPPNDSQSNEEHKKRRVSRKFQAESNSTEEEKHRKKKLSNPPKDTKDRETTRRRDEESTEESEDVPRANPYHVRGYRGAQIEKIPRNPTDGLVTEKNRHRFKKTKGQKSPMFWVAGQKKGEDATERQNSVLKYQTRRFLRKTFRFPTKPSKGFLNLMDELLPSLQALINFNFNEVLAEKEATESTSTVPQIIESIHESLSLYDDDTELYSGVSDSWHETIRASQGTQTHCGVPCPPQNFSWWMPNK